MLDVNVYHVAGMAKTLLKGLVKRPKSGIIFSSSIGGSQPVPQFNVYNATKGFVDYLVKGISLENPNLDILLLKPGFINTIVIKGYKVPTGISSAEDLVSAALRDLGK